MSSDVGQQRREAFRGGGSRQALASGSSQHQQAQSKEKNDDERKSQDSGSSSGSSSNIIISIPGEHHKSVDLCLKVAGLRPRGFMSKFFARLAKPSEPGPYMDNGRTRVWQLAADSMRIELIVKTDRKAAKLAKKSKRAKQAAAAAENDDGLEPGWELFHLKIKQFPSEIEPLLTKYDVQQPSGRSYGYINLSLVKKEAGCSWQQFLADNGTLDVAQT